LIRPKGLEPGSRPIGPDDMADGGVFTCEDDYEETVMWPVFDGETRAVRANSEERSDRGTCGSSDRPPDSPRPNFGTPQDGSPMQGITIP